jgi:glycine cleavage system regulatory protein
MTTSVILTVVGSDRPGLTQSLADAILAANGNWLESHLSRLGGKYVGSVLVELPEEQLADLERRVQAIDAAGLHVAIVGAGEGAAAGEALQLDLVGQDRLGIVREVTGVLARLGVNIEDFVTSRENGAWSGELLFRASARLTLPTGITEEAVRDALEQISGEIMVDITVSSKRVRAVA